MDPTDGHERPKTRRQATIDGQQVTQLQVKDIIAAALKRVRESLCQLADKRYIDEAIDKVKEIVVTRKHCNLGHVILKENFLLFIHSQS